MRRNVQGQRTKTRSIQRSVQVLLTVSGIVFLLAGLVLAASGASVGSAIGSVTDRFDGSNQPADDGIDSSDGDATDVGSGNETDDTSGESSDSDDGATADARDGSDSDDDGDDTDGDDSDGDDGNSSDGGDGNSSDGGDGPHSLTVTVEDQDGNTIEGATVSHNESFGDEKTTSGDGEVEWEVENGTYSVSANADGYQSAEDSVEIDGGDEPLTLRLEAEAGNDSSDDGNTVTFVVEDQNGDTLDNATVALERETLGGIRGKEEKPVDQDGEVDFERENGEYSFTVTVDGNESNEQTVDVDGDTRQPVTYETTDG
ncbi:carboxypeptidase regulatory-like domain-containing protein [Natrinema ejinorense]|uniref:Carboxypeptidase regulatory-like domain-containing protein n=1 Tax=Natrinema ejinorense TaxID=373386 RepID=A0A2A5QS72_9EURY|nr:carboxypeptidase regulatory-like domain-containing protein [Natrinema ejinorense]PCR89629.1 hypothetical protein CP557_03210 [Natrinema ejinorense]